MNFYSLGKAIYLTARYELVGYGRFSRKRPFAEFQSAKFFNLVHPV